MKNAVYAFAILLVIGGLCSRCDPHDYQRDWVGIWRIAGDDDLYRTRFLPNGIWKSWHTSNPDKATAHGTYSITEDRFTMTIVATSEFFTGRWERIADKLVLYLSEDKVIIYQFIPRHRHRVKPPDELPH